MAEYVDVEKQCKERECGNTFVLTAGEQKFFDLKGLHQPQRCPGCREKKRKQAKQASSPFSPLLGKEFPDMETADGDSKGVGTEGQE